MERKHPLFFVTRLTKKNWIQLAVLTFIFCVSAVLVYKTTIVPRTVFPMIETKVASENIAAYTLKDKDHIEQTFTYDKDQLLSVGTQILLNENRLAYMVSNLKEIDQGTIKVKILDTSTQSLLAETTYNVSLLANKQNLLASFVNALTGWENKELTMVIDVEGINEEVDLSIPTTEKVKKNTSLTIQGEEADFTLNIKTASHQFTYWKQWAMVGAGLLYLLLVGTYVGFAVLKAAPHKQFLFTGSILALIYLFLIPPLAVPDESAHLKEAYYYSNQLMGIENPSSTEILMDREDYEAMKLFKTTPSLSEYDQLKVHITKTKRAEGVEEINRFDTQAPVITYLPGILGITIGRILGLNGILVIGLGRLFSIFCYLATMYWFIKLMPFGKAAAFLMAILPMTIQQCTSYSYDSVVIEVAFLFLALYLRLMHNKEPINIPHAILFGICVIILAISKGATYLPLCLLAVMIPASRFPQWKRYKHQRAVAKFTEKVATVNTATESKRTDSKRKWIFVGGMALLGVAAFLIGTLSYVLFVAAPTAEQAATTYLAGEAYGLKGLLANPFLFINLSLKTLCLSGDVMIEQMLGMQLGWLDISVSRVVIYGFLLCMVLSVLITKNDTSNNQAIIKVKEKLFYLFVSACSMGMVFASMFMSWTPPNSVTIAGIQGRYFLPLLPILLLLFRTKNVTVKKDKTRQLIFIGVALQCVAIYCILMSVEQIL